MHRESEGGRDREEGIERESKEQKRVLLVLVVLQWAGGVSWRM